MIEIPEPPTIAACASCCSSLTWLYSARKQAWVGFVNDPIDAMTLRVHGCKHAADGPLWRHLPTREEPNAEYLAAKSKLPKPVVVDALARARADQELPRER